MREDLIERLRDAAADAAAEGYGVSGLLTEAAAALAALSAQAEAQAGGAVAGLVGVQRYFPSKPSHAGWEMTADERGEWVLWSDVVAALAQRRATVERHEPSGLDSCQPISWLVKLDGKQFVVHDEATARWWADRLTTPPAKVPEGWVLVPVEGLAREAKRLRYRSEECFGLLGHKRTDAGAQMVYTAEILEAWANGTGPEVK